MLLNDDIINVKGIGQKSQSLFYSLGIRTVKDLLLHFPRGYVSMGELKDVDNIKADDLNAVYGQIKRVELLRSKNNRNIVNVYVSDKNDRVFICSFFNMPYLKNVIPLYEYRVFYGRVTIRADRFYMQHPEIFTIEKYNTVKDNLRVFYPLAKGINNKMIEKAISEVLDNIDLNEAFVEFLNDDIRLTNGFCGRSDAVYMIHRAKNLSEIEAAKRRIIFDEFFIFLINLSKLKKDTKKNINKKKFIKNELTETVMNNLEFSLTEAQKRVVDEIGEDVNSSKLMNRLVQGDVGSGKTIVAVLAIIKAFENGFQSAFMAPTEVLAEQHYDYMLDLAEKNKLDMKISLITGSTKKSEKTKINQGLKDGEIDLVIGTHALISDSVEFYNLGLAIIDEQHRFGVNQRLKLISKDKQIHTLVMSATPIPRTLAIILYGELDVSIIDELPKNRKAVKNAVIFEEHRTDAYKLIIKEIRNGHQAYIICPMINANDEINLKNVIEYVERIERAFPKDIRIAGIHGQLSNKEKNQIMEDFKNKKIDLIVSTTVIEVGVNVPNATVIMIEDSDRFGLAQLHQLRGRVGRGSFQSYAMFMTANKSDKVLERLSVLKNSNDGFFIAGEDLKLRGPGEIFGQRQSGSINFHMADLYANADLLKLASALASRALKNEEYMRFLYRIFDVSDDTVL